MGAGDEGSELGASVGLAEAPAGAGLVAVGGAVKHCRVDRREVGPASISPSSAGA
jgi:hypothetical protein